MEVIGLTASIIAIVQLTGSCIKIGGRYLGPTKHTSKDLNELSSVLYQFHGTITTLELHHRIHEEDEARLYALSHLNQPLKKCEQALTIIKQRLENINSIEKYVTGSRFDRDLKQAMHDIAESKSLFEIAVLTDNS